MQHADGLKELNERITELSQELRQERERVNSLMITVNSHSDIIDKMNDTHAMTCELLDLFAAAKGGFKVIGWLGLFVKWVWPIAAVGVALTIYLKTGKWELKP